MSEEEKRLIELIRSAKEPGKAMEIALTVILRFVEPLQSSQEQARAYQKERA